MSPRTFALIPMFAIVVATSSYPQEDPGLVQLSPADFSWADDSDSVRIVNITGDRTGPGLYSHRVRFPAGFRVAPHFHPDDRIVVVIDGTIHVGFGETFDDEAMRALESGSVWTEPGNQPHYVWAKDGEVVIQVVGYGPSDTTQVNE